MDPKIIDGKKLAEKHEEALKKQIETLFERPRLAAILIGEDPSSVLYVNLKEKKAQELGIEFEKYLIPVRTKFNDVAQLVMSLNGPEGPHGVMIQLPVPKDFLQEHSSEELLQLIDPEKDVDGLTGKGPFLPAAVGAIVSMIKDEGIEVRGKKAVVVGASDLVGKPAAEELRKLGGIVEICDRQTENLAEKTKTAEILVTATGVPRLITGEMVKTGVVVIDVGAEKVDGRVVGDVDFESVYPKASKITPVPGGVGPLTVVSLLENVVKLTGDGNV